MTLLLDERTLTAALGVLYVVGAVTRGILWLDNRQRFRGLHLWFLDAVAVSAALLMWLFRDNLPTYFGEVIAPTLLFAALVLLLLGFEEFFDVWPTQPRRTFNTLLLMVALGAFYYMHTQTASRQYLGIAFYTVLAVLLSEIVWVISRYISPQLRPLAEPSAIILAFMSVLSLLRLAFLLGFPISLDGSFPNSFPDMLSSLLFFLLLVALNINLVMLVARRLLWEIQAEERKFNRVFHLAPNAMFVVDMKTALVIDVNEGFCRLFGTKVSNIVGKKLDELPIWLKSFEVMEIMHRITMADIVVTREFECKKADGGRISVIYSASPMRMHDKEYMIASMEEITALSKVKSQLEQMATHDALTGLPNRRLLYDHFAKAAARADRNGTKVAFILFDIDDFKNVNDVLGHSTGDELLMQVADRLVQVSRQQDTIGRLGGDEFGLLLVDVQDEADIITVANRLRGALTPPFDVLGHRIRVTISAGCAIFPDHGKTLEELLQKADYAMYYVKKQGKDGFCFFEASMQS